MDEILNQIVEKHFGEKPKSITRMTSGIRNEVYLVSLRNNEVIIRLNQSDTSLKGSSKYIPLFRSKGIKVPEIIAEDFSKTLMPYCYQILGKIEGQDLGFVIQDLSEQDLKNLAQEISSIIKVLRTIPTDGKFGPVETEVGAPFSSWEDVLEKMLNTIKERNLKTQAVGDDLIQLFSQLLEKYKDYFSKVASEFYFDDMNSKNVMINAGKFSGLVDLDSVIYGDPLDLVGTIKTSWFGTSYGKFYTDSIEKYLELGDKEKEMVTVYAILNKIYWTSEIGIQFNENTKPVVDWEKVKANKEQISLLLAEIGSD